MLQEFLKRLGLPSSGSLRSAMLTLLRAIGIFNAAIWLGSSLFFAFIVAPTLLAAPMKASLGHFWAGYATQAVIAKLFWIHHSCATIALIATALEHLYVGKSTEKALTWVLLLVLGLGLIGGFGLQPVLKELHLKKYQSRPNSPEQIEASKAFGIWHGVSQVANLVCLAGIAFYLWKTAFPKTGQRTASIPRFNA